MDITSFPASRNRIESDQSSELAPGSGPQVLVRPFTRAQAMLIFTLSFDPLIFGAPVFKDVQDLEVGSSVHLDPQTTRKNGISPHSCWTITHFELVQVFVSLLRSDPQTPCWVSSVHYKRRKGEKKKKGGHRKRIGMWIVLFGVEHQGSHCKGLSGCHSDLLPT